ncbi:MAG TPA: hypothetical protein VHX63_03840 [Acidobacteriaceae bacterium]|nr:hypothetical protein [Acidobacteriaceae bacterium]
MQELRSIYRIAFVKFGSVKRKRIALSTQSKISFYSLISVFFSLIFFSPHYAEAVKQVRLNQCGRLSAGNTVYLLEKDVSSSGTCFAIEASNITLNLNGHTITYGVAGGKSPAPAFTLCDGWYKYLSSSQCGGHGHAHFTVYDGTVIQAAMAPPFSPVFWVGQGIAVGEGVIHNIKATFSSPGSQFFYGDYAGAGWKIRNNTINDNVTNIQHSGQGPLSARSQLQGYAIKIDDGRGAKGVPDEISGNIINGSPQGGISDGQPGTKIYNNEIRLASTYTNDYGVLSMADKQNIHDNIVTGHGRGLDAEGSDFILNHNTIDVQEIAKNTEYDGCELGGTYGIRVKNYNVTHTSKGFSIINNHVTVHAGPCQANGLVFTNMIPTVTATISSNIIATIAGSAPDYAIAFNSVNNLNGMTYSHNTFIASICALIDNTGDIGSGANTTVQAGQTWKCGMAGPTVKTMDLTTAGNPKNSYPEYLKITDAIPKPVVSCGPYSTAFVQIGSFHKQCVGQPLDTSSNDKH